MVLSPWCLSARDKPGREAPYCPHGGRRTEPATVGPQKNRLGIACLERLLLSLPDLPTSLNWANCTPPRSRIDRSRLLAMILLVERSCDGALGTRTGPTTSPPAGCWRPWGVRSPTVTRRHVRHGRLLPALAPPCPGGATSPPEAAPPCGFASLPGQFRGADAAGAAYLTVPSCSPPAIPLSGMSVACKSCSPTRTARPPTAGGPLSGLVPTLPHGRSLP